MIELIKRAWSQEAAEGLADALGDKLPVIGGEITAGRCELWEVVGYGWAVTRLQERQSGLVLELVGGQRFEDAKFCYLDSVKAFANLADSVGAVSVEVGTHRPGIGKILNGIGFKESARTYELDLMAVKNG